ncbi:cytochrome c oxidase subunit NDUFA4 [Mixophyes fleayi]|uniref:cytochrome c oxidase subunit NDUFA4 n=1 Tax=Mixophyes fleayi TaxID=3061075 RepID=UPI003F4E41E6
MFRTMLAHGRKHPSLIPLFVFVGLGAVGSAAYAIRVALTSPEIAWDKKNNPDPWNKKSANYQYKFYNETIDYKNLKKDRPDF